MGLMVGFSITNSFSKEFISFYKWWASVLAILLAKSSLVL